MGARLLQGRNTLEWNVTRGWAPDSFAFLPDYDDTIGCLICVPASPSTHVSLTCTTLGFKRYSSRKMNPGGTLNITHLTLY